MRHEHGDKVNARTRNLLEARLHDPFSVLGLHRHSDRYGARVFAPAAGKAWLQVGERCEDMRPEHDGVFRWSSDTAPHRPIVCAIR